MSKTQYEGVQEKDNYVVLKVAGGSPAPKVAGAIAKYMQEGKRVSLVAIGAGAVNQAVKAICIARGMVASYGWNLFVIPAFVDERIDGDHKTAIQFRVYKED